MKFSNDLDPYNEENWNDNEVKWQVVMVMFPGPGLRSKVRINLNEDEAKKLYEELWKNNNDDYTIFKIEKM